MHFFERVECVVSDIYWYRVALKHIYWICFYIGWSSMRVGVTNGVD